jgi:hypothetical protein
MTSVGQSVNIILEGNCMEIATQNYVVAITGHFQKVGLAPRSGTSIFYRVFLEIAFRDGAHVDFVSDMPRDITSRDYNQMGRMIACWIHIFKLHLIIGITHIGPNLITQGFVSPCHIYYIIYYCRVEQHSS